MKTMYVSLKQLLLLMIMGCLIAGMGTVADAAGSASVTAENTSAPQVTAEVPANFSGISKLKYYKKGQQVNAKGWVKYKGEYYFFKNGQALTGWNYVRDLSGSAKYYKYYFSKSGILSQNLFKTFGAKARKQRMKIFVNLTTHNITIFFYDRAKKDYIIPAKSWVCATARDGHSTVPGNYHLSKSSASSWFIYKQSDPYHYYQYKVKIHGSRMLFHSEMYRGTSKRKLVARTYNGLGTNQTTRCIRSQCGNAYLIYRIAKENKYTIPVKIYRSKNKGPFGKKTLANSGGKIKSNSKYDPTDPLLTKYKKVW